MVRPRRPLSRRPQNEDGSWTGKGTEGDPRVGTAFALLFLTRATPTLDAAPEAQPSGPGMLDTHVTLADRTPRVYLILDASGSMLAEVDGQQKFAAARDAVRRMVEVLPDEASVALRVYGHRRRAIQPDADEDTELLIDWGPLDRAAFTQTLDALRPRGKTPLALSLEQARADLPRGDDPVVVILVTDGGEDAGGAPVEAAAALGSAFNGSFYVVGFDINQPRWTQQLEQMANAAGGAYWPVRQAPALTRGLEAIVAPPAPAFTLTRTDDDTTLGPYDFNAPPIELPPGEYRLDTEHLGHAFTTTFWINPEATTRINLDAAELKPKGPAALNAPTPTRPTQATTSTTPPTNNTNANPNASNNTPPDAAPEPTAPARFCTNCGQPLNAGARFCTNCGQAVSP